MIGGFSFYSRPPRWRWGFRMFSSNRNTTKDVGYMIPAGQQEMYSSNSLPVNIHDRRVPEFPQHSL